MKAIFKFVLTLAIIILLIFVGIPRVVAYIARYNESKDIVVNDLEYSLEDYWEELEYEPSEIEGMTKLDKYKMGLSPEEIDTDYDGLTDDEELNIYHSDPTKRSTSDDFYSDKYKIDNGMNINQKYDFEGELTYEWNMCPEVSLKAGNIDDLYAVVTLKSIPNIKDLRIFAGYTIYNYSGEVSIDISDIIKNYEVSNEDINVYGNSLNNTEISQLSYSMDGNSIKLKEKFDYDDVNYIYLVDKNTETKAVDARRILSDYNMVYFYDSEAYDPSNVKAIVKVKPFWGFIMNWFFHIQAFTNIYYVDSGDAEINEQALQRLVDQVNYMYAIRKGTQNPFTLNSKCIKCVSQEKYESLMLGCRTLDPDGTYKFEGDVKNQPAEQFFLYCYWTYDDTYSFDYDYSTGHQIAYKGHNLSSEVEEEYNLSPQAKDETLRENEKATWHPDHNQKPKTTFSLDKDTLPFENCTSFYSPHGSCMGMSVLTAKLFNDGKTETKGVYDFYGVKDSWNINKHIENKTLTNPGLHDYKDADFVKKAKKQTLTEVRVDKKTGKHLVLYKNKVIDSTNDESLEEFFKMIGTYHMSYNAIIKKDCQRYHTGREYFRYKQLKKVLDYLDNGKVVVVGLLNNIDYPKEDKEMAKRILKGEVSDGGHAIIAYDYIKKKDGNIVFRVYDSNFPQDKNRVLEIQFMLFPSKEADGIAFSYNSIVDFGSNIDYGDKYEEYYSLIFLDEDGNILFPDTSNPNDVIELE